MASDIDTKALALCFDYAVKAREDMKQDDVPVLMSFTISEARTISRVLREAAEGWRPIETAPKDGTWFLAWRGPAPSGSYWTNPVAVRWFVFEEEDGGSWCWPDTIYEVLSEDGIERANSLLAEGECYDDSTNFTHWRPLPPPPATETTNSQEMRRDDQ